MDLRKIDALVAQHVTGWTLARKTDAKLFHANVDWSEVLPKYSTDISAAWEVVEKMNARHDDYTFEIWKRGTLNWYASFITDTEFWAMGETAPLAISYAALKVKGVDYDVT